VRDEQDIAFEPRNLHFGFLVRYGANMRKILRNRNRRKFRAIRNWQRTALATTLTEHVMGLCRYEGEKFDEID
jgi:hypothetical protein